MNGPHQYLETDVMTASPYRLHLLVIDGALRFARQAEEALVAEDPETAHLALNKSRKFVGELISGLDSQRAPELVEQLHGLFLFVYRSLSQADLDHDPQRARDAIRILALHRETWVALADKLQQEAAANDSLPQKPHPQRAGEQTWKIDSIG